MYFRLASFISLKEMDGESLALEGDLRWSARKDRERELVSLLIFSVLINKIIDCLDDNFTIANILLIPMLLFFDSIYFQLFLKQWCLFILVLELNFEEYL